MAPIPGMSPRKNPMMVPRPMAPVETFHSSRLGRRSVILALMTSSTGASMLSRISPTPKRPMTTGMKPMPSYSGGMPKVKRGAPRTGSIPTIANISPNMVMIRAANIDLPERPVTRERPTTSKANTSGGPKRSAKVARGKDTTIRAKVAKVPPMKEPIAAIPRAGPALPCLAIW